MADSQKSPQKPPSLFEVRNTVHAAVLLAAGLPFHGHRCDGRSVAFLLADAARASELLSQFLAGSLEVNAKSLVDHMNILRDLARATLAAERGK